MPIPNLSLPNSCREGAEGPDAAVPGVSAAADVGRVQRAADGEVGVRGDGAARLRVQRRGRQAHLRHEERGSTWWSIGSDT